MAALSDASWGFANEATFKTYATPTRWYEVMEPDYNVNKSVKQGKGMRVGTRVDRSGRRVVTSADGTGSVGVELVTKGLGLLLESCLGTSTVTLVSGSTYQHNFTLANGTTIPSRTIQTGTLWADGTVNPVSYLGCMVDQWDLEIPNDDIATLKTSWDCADYTTAQAYAAPSYAAAPNLLHFGQAAITIGGTVTAPTTTALASGGTAVTNVRSFKLSGDNMSVKNRLNFGGGGRKSRQLVGDAGLTGELEIEYTDNTIRDAFLADTPVPITVTLTSTEALSTGFAQLQIVLPEVKLNGDTPRANGADLSILKVPFNVLDNLTATQPIWIVTRTADTAI